MTIEESVLEKLQSLTPERKQEVLNFVESLARRNSPVHSRRSMKGAFAHLGLHFSEAEIDEARREIWGNFPRENI